MLRIGGALDRERESRDSSQVILNGMRDFSPQAFVESRGGRSGLLTVTE
jgi:hypothetical protein